MKQLLRNPIIKSIAWTLGGFLVTILCGLLAWGIYSYISTPKKTTGSDPNTNTSFDKEVIIDLKNSNIEIYGIDGSTVNFEAEGTDSEIKKIKTTETARRYKVSNKSLFNFNFFGKTLTTNQNTVRIDVPQGQKLKITTSDSSRILLIGYKGDIDLKMVGSGKFESINCEFDNAKIFQIGPASADIFKVNNELEIEMNGSGMIKIGEVNLQDANIELSGAGGIYIDKGTIENASVKIDGSGTVRIPKVNKNFQQSIKGSGEINFSSGS
jgi:hypothetical protein